MIKITEEFYNMFTDTIFWCLPVFWISRFLIRKEYSYTSYLRKETLILYESFFVAIILADLETREYGYNIFPRTSPLFSFYQTLILFGFVFWSLCGRFVDIPFIPRQTKSDKSIIDSIHRMICLEDLRLPFEDKKKPWKELTIAEQNAYKEKAKEQMPLRVRDLVLSLLFFFIFLLHYGKILGAYENRYLKYVFQAFV